MSAHKLEPRGKWIVGRETIEWRSPMDRPEVRQPVLIATSDRRSEGYWDGSAWRWSIGLFAMQRVIAWAEMPRGPQQQSEQSREVTAAYQALFDAAVERASDAMDKP